MAKRLKFSGRTPSRISGTGTRADAFFGGAKLLRGHAARVVALRVAMSALALLLLVALFRAPLANRAARGGNGGAAQSTLPRPLTPWRFGANLPNFQTRAQVQSAAPGFVETLLAPLIWLGESVRAFATPNRSTLSGALWLVALLFLAVSVWFVLAQLGEWRRPSLPAVLLLLLQLVGIAVLLSAWRWPSLRVETPFTAFDFRVTTTHSGDLLTPQQQINRHRAAGFKGLVFTDSLPLPQSTLDGLRAANPDLLLLNGSEQRGPQAHLLFLGARLPNVARGTSASQAIAQAKKLGALVLVAQPWRPGRLSVDQLISMGADGVVAWNGSTWDRALVEKARARNWIVVGASSLGAREDFAGGHNSDARVWTLLPRGMDESGDVWRALGRRKTAVVSTLADADTPQAQTSSRHIFGSLRDGWHTLGRALQLSALLGIVVSLALVWAWGAQKGHKPTVPTGPKTAVGFLRRRRLTGRLMGAALVVLAFALTLTLLACVLNGSAVGEVLQRLPPARMPALQSFFVTPPLAITLWIAADTLFFYGRALWNRTH